MGDTSERLTAIVFEHLVLDHGVSVSTCHQVRWHHDCIDHLLFNRLVVRNSTLGADDAEAPHAAPRRFGDIKLHVDTCWKQHGNIGVSVVRRKVLLNHLLTSSVL